jgi:hypothetical protein
LTENRFGGTGAESDDHKHRVATEPIQLGHFLFRLLPLANIGDAGRLSATTGPHQENQNDIAALSEQVQHTSYTCCERFRQSLFFYGA